MRWQTISCALLIIITGCSSKAVDDFLSALAMVPFVDRTEKEINDWFDNQTIVDDKPISPAAINGEPSVLLVHEGPDVTVNGTSYPGVLCVTQFNAMGNQKLKYAARVGIEVLDNPNLFGAGQVQLGSCDGGPQKANVTAGHSDPELKSAFRDAVAEWLKQDIVATLKSNTNKEGFANPANVAPRNPATTRGTFYNVYEATAPSVRVIGFFAH